MHSLYLFEKKGDPFDYRQSFCWTSCHHQPLLDYLWDISGDWERLQGTKTQLCI